MSLPVLRLQAGRAGRVAGGHPWIYSNEVVMDGAAKALTPGTLVDFLAADGQFLGRGSFNPKTLIAGRVFSFDQETNVDRQWFKVKLASALALREKLVTVPFYRLVHAEADGLPGLIIDRFDAKFVLQLNCAGMDLLWPELDAALRDLFDPDTVVLRNDSFSRDLEGLPRGVKVVRGTAAEPVELTENGWRYFADLAEGQKTGWFFDQRENRRMMADLCAGATVLDLYTHTGGFAIAAACAGAAQTTGVDGSELALSLAVRAAEANGIAGKCRWHRADVFEDLERRRAAGERYDVVIADPPAFVKSKKDLAAGARGYRKLARLASSLVRDGGFFFIISCSHNMDLATFTAEAAQGLYEAKRQGRILRTCFAAPDHPVHPRLAETAYLKGLLFQVTA